MILFSKRSSDDLMHFMTQFAISAFFVFYYSSVFFIKFMPSNAMCLSFVFCLDTFTSQNIDSFFNRFKMFWINTNSIPAKMINFKTQRNWTFYKFVRKTMSPLHGPLSIYFDAKLSVTKAIHSIPKPTMLRFCDSIPKALFNSFSCWSHQVLNTLERRWLELNKIPMITVTY